MKKSFIISLFGIGILTTAVLSGCGNNAKDYCSDGIECYNTGKFLEAESYFEKAVELKPDNEVYNVYLGLVQIDLLEYNEASAVFEKIIESNDDNREAHRGLGLVYYNMEAYEKAVTEFMKADELSDGSYDKLHIDILKYLGNCYNNLQKYDEAIDIYTEIIDKDAKNNADIYYLRGCIYIKQDNESGAASDFETLVDIQGEDYQLLSNMYTSFKEAGYDDRAESYLMRIINSDDATNMVIGKTYYFLGQYAKAEEYLLDAYEEGDEYAPFYLAMNYEAMENYVNADNLYKEYMGKHPNRAEIYNQYGAYLLNRGQYANALVYIENGLELEDSATEQALLYNQAVCYEYLNDYTKALELFNEYIKNYPLDKAAQREIQFLESR